MPTTREVGLANEHRAIAVLERSGYHIVETNYERWIDGTKIGELDVVARDGACLVFVEVRSRSDDDHGDAAETVGRRKQLQLAKMAELYLADRNCEAEFMRFDVVAINGDDIALYRDAFRLGDLR